MGFLNFTFTCHLISWEERTRFTGVQNKQYVCVYPGCRMLLPKIVAREELQGPLIILSGSQEKGGLLIRACSVIRSNTVNRNDVKRLKKHMLLKSPCHIMFNKTRCAFSRSRETI